MLRMQRPRRRRSNQKQNRNPWRSDPSLPPPTGELTIDISPVRELSGELAGFQPFTRKKQGAPRGNTRASDALIFKRETLNRLLRLRENGITIAQIVNASKDLKEETVLDILGTKKVPIGGYRLLATAMDKVEKEVIMRT